MEILFIDESGDNGFSEGSTDYFVLAGISIESTYWKEYFWRLSNLKREISKRYGVRLHEFKSSDIFTHRGVFYNSIMEPDDLFFLYSQLIELICSSHTTIFAVAEFKKEFKQRQGENSNPKKIIKQFDEAIWNSFLLMYDNFLYKKSTQKARPQNAVLYSDNKPGQEKYIRAATRKFSRKFDTTKPYPETGIVEDIVFRDSTSSPFLQLADITAFSINRLIINRQPNDIFSISKDIQHKLL